MTVHLRREQCCESEDCTRPARHGALCVACYMAATPARRAVERLCDERPLRCPDYPPAA